MPLRNVALGEDDIIPLHSANRYFGLFKIETSLVSAFFCQRDRKHIFWLPFLGAAKRALSALKIANQKKPGQGNRTLRVHLVPSW